MLNFNNVGLPSGYQTFVSRPDLIAPIIDVNGSGTPGLVLFNHFGKDIHQPALVISDHNGDIVYINNSLPSPINLDVQTYREEQYLTFWNGTWEETHGCGIFYMMDDTLNIVNSVPSRGGGDESVDMHDFTIVDESAVVTFYRPLEMNLTKWGGPADGYVSSSGFQRIDIKSGEMLFEWDSAEYVSLDDSKRPMGEIVGNGTYESPWDYFHINSVDVHPIDGAWGFC